MQHLFNAHKYNPLALPNQNLGGLPASLGHFSKKMDRRNSPLLRNNQLCCFYHVYHFGRKIPESKLHRFIVVFSDNVVASHPVSRCQSPGGRVNGCTLEKKITRKKNIQCFVLFVNRGRCLVGCVVLEGGEETLLYSTHTLRNDLIFRELHSST